MFKKAIEQLNEDIERYKKSIKEFYQNINELNSSVSARENEIFHLKSNVRGLQAQLDQQPFAVEKIVKERVQKWEQKFVDANKLFREQEEEYEKVIDSSNK